MGPLEIFAWMIEHPEGRFIVDTGDSAENSSSGYLPLGNPFFTKQ
jgi:N-acyl homoserine lactone hydrolase